MTMRVPIRRRVLSTLATFKRCRTVHWDKGGFDCATARPDLTLPLRNRAAIIAFAWRHGIRNPGSIWCPCQRGHDHHITVWAR
jgi:hypothetical protein